MELIIFNKLNKGLVLPFILMGLVIGRCYGHMQESSVYIFPVIYFAYPTATGITWISQYGYKKLQYSIIILIDIPWFSAD